MCGNQHYEAEKTFKGQHVHAGLNESEIQFCMLVRQNLGEIAEASVAAVLAGESKRLCALSEAQILTVRGLAVTHHFHLPALL
ncbi:MAG: hypothetical protein WAX38_00070 [Minisyncoccia bacterium]